MAPKNVEQLKTRTVALKKKLAAKEKSLSGPAARELKTANSCLLGPFCWPISCISEDGHQPFQKHENHFTH